MISLDEFFTGVLISGLLGEEQLSQVGAPHGATAEETARSLVRARLLTPFQARALLTGEARSFFVTERYKILEHLGRGGMGEVYMVEHLLLRRVVAMKLISAADPQSGGPGAVERFLREARAVAALDHPNVVRVFDMDRTPSGPFLVMEYVDGSNLHAVVNRTGPLSADRAVDAIRQAAAGLGHAHAAGLVHRDVKPGNLLLDRMGTVRVVDLGLARYRDASMNAGLTGMYDDNRVIGTADFQAPEQGLDSGSADARSDVYGLGAALFYLLTGRVPYPEGTITNKLLAHQMKPPPNAAEVNPEVSPELAAVVQRLMAKRPTDRPQTMAEVRTALAPWQAAELDPPTSSEMPKHPPSAYRLGLCPPPALLPSGVRFVGGVPPGGSSFDIPRTPPVTQRMARPSGAGTSTPRGPLTQRLPKPPILVEPIPEPDSAPVPVQLVEPGPTPIEAERRPTRRGLLIGLGVGAVASAVGGGLLWYLNSQGSGQPTRPTTPNVPQPSEPKRVTPTGAELVGSGSTFIAPAMEVWGREYAGRTGVAVKFTGGGSGKGVTNALERDQPFGCSDDPVSEKEFEKFKVNPAELLHVPLALGAVVPMYNLPGIAKPLQFTGPLLAKIFLGEITNWKDDRLSVCSPTDALPDLPISTVYREESSGTTAVWADFLCKVSPTFEAELGRGKVLNWKVGTKAKGNLAVAQTISGKLGAIGYVELTYALKEAGQYGHVQNKKGKMVPPSPETVTAAAALAAIPDDLRFSLTYTDGDDAYPIAACTWAILFKKQKRSVGQELVKFLRWATHEGQKLLPPLKYATLPATLVVRIDAKLDAVEFTD